MDRVYQSKRFLRWMATAMRKSPTVGSRGDSYPDRDSDRSAKTDGELTQSSRQFHPPFAGRTCPICRDSDWNADFQNHMTARCSTQSNEATMIAGGVPPKTARRRGVPPISDGVPRSVMSIQCVEHWVERRYVGRLATYVPGCSTESPTNIGGGGGRRRSNLRGRRPQNKNCQKV